MQVALGSTNPVKVAATERALGHHQAADVEPVDVDTAVPEQPRGHAQTIAGAQNRAEAALAFGEPADLGVGIEGGVADLGRASGGDRAWRDDVAVVGRDTDLYLVMWAAVADGTRTTRGAGPSIPLPEDVAVRVRDGTELSPALAAVLGIEDVGTDQGAAGVLTDGVVDREAALVQAVAAAAAPFLTDHY
ncbi:MAG: DUF84 family protein [Halorientalis sp.]